MKINTTPNKTDAGDDKSPRLIHNVRQEGWSICVLELMAVVDLFSGFNKLMNGFQVEPDESPGTAVRLRGGRQDAVSISEYGWARWLAPDETTHE